MSAIEIVRGTTRAGQFLSAGRILRVPEDMSAEIANELTAAGRARWTGSPTSPTKHKPSARAARKRAAST